MKKEFERRLEKITAKVKAKGIAVESEVTHGHVALEIERAIRDYRPELITMGNRFDMPGSATPCPAVDSDAAIPHSFHLSFD